MGTKLVVMSASGPRWERRLPVRSALDAPQSAAYAAVCYAVVCYGEDRWLRSETLGLYPCISPCWRTEGPVSALGVVRHTMTSMRIIRRLLPHHLLRPSDQVVRSALAATAVPAPKPDPFETSMSVLRQHRGTST